MDIQVNVNKEDVEKHVVEAIINSSIGESVRRSVKNAFGNIQLDRSIDQAIGQLVVNYARDFILEDPALRADLEAKVRAKLESQDMINRVIDKALSNIIVRDF